MNKFTYLALIGCTSAIRRDPLLSWEPTRPADSHPINYPVADLGKSHEIIYTENNIKNAEKALGNNWEIKKDATWPAGVDTQLDVKLLQLNREPLLSADASPLEVHESPKYWDHLVDYPKLDLGVSHEI